MSHGARVSMLDVTQFIACGLYKWKAGNDSNRDAYEKKL
jgi:hypothetical protein